MDVVTTNTYSSARHNLLPLGLGDKVRELNLRAVMLARDARDSAAKERPVWIGGSVSNDGLMAGAERGWQDYQYFRDRVETTENQARANLREQAEILAESGVDFLIAEPTGSTVQRGGYSKPASPPACRCGPASSAAATPRTAHSR